MACSSPPLQHLHGTRLEWSGFDAIHVIFGGHLYDGHQSGRGKGIMRAGWFT